MRAPVEPLDVAPRALLHGRRDPHLGERDIGVLVQPADRVAVVAKRAHEAHHDKRPLPGEQRGDLAGTADVLAPPVTRQVEIPAQAAAQLVAVERDGMAPVRGQTRHELRPRRAREIEPARVSAPSLEQLRRRRRRPSRAPARP